MAQSQSAGSVRRPRGFTLTELLVVVSIICLVMSVLLPSLNHAQRRGEQIHCLANQHQLVLAWLLYAPDHEDKLCPAESYASALKPYVGMEEVFLCKGVAGPPGSRSYGVSNTMGGRESRDGVTPFEKLHMVSRPVERIVFVDKRLHYSNCFWPVMRYGENWVWRPSSWPLSASLDGLTFRHNNGCNITFADGHGEYTHWKDDRTVLWMKGRIAGYREASTDNRDLEFLVAGLTHK